MKIYRENAGLRIRSMLRSDAETFVKVLRSYGREGRAETYLEYFAEQEEGTRNVYVAEQQGEIAGYCTLIPVPRSGPWKGGDKPEISDLRVFNEYQGMGIGDTILSVVEEDAAKLADEVTLAVGLHHGYGSAQRLYIKRGYVPDGSGVWYDSRVLEQNDDCCNDDSLKLYLSKRLSPRQMEEPGCGAAARVTVLGMPDSGEILTLQRAAYAMEAVVHDDVGLPPLTQSLDELRDELADPQVTALGVRREGRLIGAVRLRRSGDVMELCCLVVAPDLQGQGIGTRLLREAEAALPGIREIRLLTGEHNSANIRLYTRMGYQETGRTPVGHYELVNFTKRMTHNIRHGSHHVKREDRVGDWELRPPTHDDAPSVLEAFLGDPEMKRQGSVTDLASAERYIARLTSKGHESLVAADAEGVFAMVAASLDEQNLSAWVFYWSHPRARRRGITSHLVREFANRLLDEKGMRRLELGYRVNNLGSAMVAERAGFLVEGVAREKFLIDGEAYDVIMATRLPSDPWPED